MSLEKSSCHLKIEEQELVLQVLKSNQTMKAIALKTGYKKIQEIFFKHQVPMESEIELAINFIEDELMSNKELLEPKGTLYTSDQSVIDLLKKNGLQADLYPLRDIEGLFSRYARVIMGAPASEIDTQISPEDVAILLVLREVMHHLGFEELKISITRSL